MLCSEKLERLFQMNIRFYEQKPNLELKEFDDNIYVYIYLNEEVKEEVEINYPESVNEENVKHTVYYYDYAEFWSFKSWICSSSVFGFGSSVTFGT